jgi:hypothetical protein
MVFKGYPPWERHRMSSLGPRIPTRGCWGRGGSRVVVGLNPMTGVDRKHESREARSLYPSALQLACALRLEFIGRAT